MPNQSARAAAAHRTHLWERGVSSYPGGARCKFEGGARNGELPAGAGHCRPMPGVGAPHHHLVSGASAAGAGERCCPLCFYAPGRLCLTTSTCDIWPWSKHPHLCLPCLSIARASHRRFRVILGASSSAYWFLPSWFLICHAVITSTEGSWWGVRALREIQMCHASLDRYRGRTTRQCARRLRLGHCKGTVIGVVGLACALGLVQACLGGLSASLAATSSLGIWCQIAGSPKQQ